MQYKSQAKIFKFAYDNSLIEMEKIIAWADAIIAQENNPPIWVIEISLSSPKDLPSLLDEVPGPENIKEIWLGLKRVLRDAVECKKLRPESAIGYLNALMQDKIAPKNDYDDILYFIMNWDVVEEGFIEKKELVKELLHYLEKN